MSIETLSRLAGGSISYDSGGGRGKPKHSLDEVSGSLAGLERIFGTKLHELLIRASVCDDFRVKQIDVLMFEYCVTYAVSKGWKAEVGKPVFRSIGRIIMNEIINRKGSLCWNCKGTGLVNDKSNNPTEVCPECDGSGAKRPSGREMARACGVPETTWRNKWQPRYSELREKMFDDYHKATRHVINQLKEVDESAQV